ncbi:RNA polymerase sigma factor [Aristaeella lactis]|uniref:RNA polymerase sigma-70 factor, ECF subfamily n=1 Tax=Aristaeella lactis TaxID=3046383 RepID=A0AC61PN13_9FIRM|nr:sigma-70 family RNA polymerase sigma factor [Aristaeella lactis]QUA52766.1 sigma-70 family RNA polymerase sigma factor [Aristaeella lactis]SMC73150.1 RNA polymerase sigma-70 factor, ECF subfamily [Aristaeella lactis]
MTEFEFEQQVTALTQQMYRVSASLLRSPQDRQDAVQECVWKAWRKLPQLRDESLFKAWIMRILVNECKRMHRAHWREVAVDEIEIEQPDGVDNRLRDEVLHSAVMQLPEKLRLAVTLFYIDGFSMRETAQILRCPEGTVKQRLHRARTALRILLEKEV